MDIFIPEEVKLIFNTLNDNGFEAFIVGGSVRDTLLNREILDWDITTSAKPENIISLFPNTIPTGIKHGTISVRVNNKSYEVTTYRIDGNYTDNRHPDNVTFTESIYEDLSRRDFTINSMAYNFESGIIDPFNGVEDLKNKIIRAVGLPNLRFSEDALRMLRAIRFSTKLNFSIEEATFNAIKSNSSLITDISLERIREEINKILLSDKPSIGIELLKETNLLKYIFPEFIPTIGFNQHNPHHDKDIFYHTLAVLDYSPNRLLVRLAALLHDIGKPNCFTIDKKGIGHFYNHDIESGKIAKEILIRLRYDNDTIRKVVTLITEHMCLFKGSKESTLKGLIVRVGKHNLEDLFDLLIADRLGHKMHSDLGEINLLREKAMSIIASGDPLAINDLDISGLDLINLGFNKGPIIGEILQYLLTLVIVNPIKNKKALLIEEVTKHFPQ